MVSQGVIDILVYYLSEYDLRAFNALGFDTRSEGFNALGIVFQKKPNYLKRLRDEFDVVTSSYRKGQRNRPPLKRIVHACNQLSGFSFDSLTEIVMALIENAKAGIDDADPSTADISLQNPSETDLENILNFEDPAASIQIKTRDNRIRIYNVGIIKQLKKLYGGRCQLCGERPLSDYDADICEAHHIDYFSSSQNNNAANIIILCPNHHRLLHKVNPSFNPARKCFIFPNGTALYVKLDYHLAR